MSRLLNFLANTSYVRCVRCITHIFETRQTKIFAKYFSSCTLAALPIERLSSKVCKGRRRSTDEFRTFDASEKKQEEEKTRSFANARFPAVLLLFVRLQFLYRSSPTVQIGKVFKPSSVRNDGRKEHGIGECVDAQFGRDFSLTLERRRHPKLRARVSLRNICYTRTTSASHRNITRST